MLEGQPSSIGGIANTKMTSQNVKRQRFHSLYTKQCGVQLLQDKRYGLRKNKSL